jgi:hypothetical protein
MFSCGIVTSVRLRANYLLAEANVSAHSCSLDVHCVAGNTMGDSKLYCMVVFLSSCEDKMASSIGLPMLWARKTAHVFS